MRKIILPIKLVMRNGWYKVSCPSLPCCVSAGQTEQAALRNIRKAIKLQLAWLAEAGLPLVDGVCY